MKIMDPISDMLTRIRNANAVAKESVDVPASKMKLAVAEALKREGYVRDVRSIDEGTTRAKIRIYLKYGPDGEKVITEIKGLSTPGRRIYRSVGELKPVLEGLGISIVSTSKGVLSDREARKEKVGGEIICNIW